MDANKEMVETASKDLLNNLKDLENVSMALLGLLRGAQYLKDPSKYKPAVDALVKQLDSISLMLGDYIETSAGEFAASTYGPTALTSFMALLHLEYTVSFPGVDKQKHLDRAEAILKSARAKAWDPKMGAFRFAPKDTRMMLYPNITMMLAYARSYQLTKNAEHWERFKETYNGIQALKNSAGDHYHSPYSAKESGAKDEDYSTLSSQNYLMMGLWVAYEASGEQKYLAEIDKLMGFIGGKLLAKGRIMHHWVNGRAANEQDKYPYCLGCNLQTLYILVMLQGHAAGS